MKFPAPSQLAKLKLPLPLDSILLFCLTVYEHLVNLVVAVFFTLFTIRYWTRNQVHSFLDLCSLYRNLRSFTASIHSLEHPTQIASRRAGLIFNSRYDLNPPRFIVLNNASPSHCLLPIVGRPKGYDCLIHCDLHPLSPP